MIRKKISQKEGIYFAYIAIFVKDYSKEIIRVIEKNYGDEVRIFKMPISQSIRVTECASEGISIFKCDPKGKAALGYESLAHEIMDAVTNGGDLR